MSHSLKKMIGGLAALVALALGGAAIADATTSQSTTSTTTQSQSTQSAQAPPRFNGPMHGTAAHEDREKPVTGSAAAKAQSAAVKLVGSGTAGPVTTDLQGTGYETTVTKSGGGKVEVHLDSSFQAMQGPGGPGGPGHAAPNGQAPPNGQAGPPANGTYNG